MTIRLFLLATACVGIALAAISFCTRQSATKNRQKLEAAISAQQHPIAQLDAQEHTRSEALKNTTEEIKTLKRKVSTPDESVGDLPQYLQLPEPITPIPQDWSDERSEGTGPSQTPPKPAGSATHFGALSSWMNPHNGFYLPSSDAKPLFDFVQASRLCDLQLSSARSDLQDERAKSADLAHERDQAVRAAKRGPMIPRLRRDVKWLLIGATLALVASSSLHSVSQRAPNPLTAANKYYVYFPGWGVRTLCIGLGWSGRRLLILGHLRRLWGCFGV
jgi:hypothetical protein